MLCCLWCSDGEAWQRLHCQYRIGCRYALGAVFEGVDILLAPCVAGEAPKGFETTGDTQLQEFWTALHVPTISLPIHKGPEGLPLGVQLVAPLYEDARLLAYARWVMAQFGKT